MRTERQKGILALVLLNIVGASMGVFARYLHRDLLLFQQVCFRVLAAFLIGCIVFNKDLKLSKIKKISIKEWGLLIFRAIIIYLLGITLGTRAFILAKYSNVSFIMALPMTAILGVIIFKERLTAKKIIYILLAFLGVILITVKDYSHIFNWEVGEFFALFAISLVSLGNVSRRLHSDILNNKELTQLILLIAGILLFFTSIISGESLSNINWSGNLIWVILGAGLFNNIYMLSANYGFQKIDAILANNILALQSIVSLMIGLIIFREIPTIKELMGGLIIIVSVLLMNKVQNKKVIKIKKNLNVE